MGMYTGFQFHLRLRPDTPPDIIELLRSMCDHNRDPEVEFVGRLPQHPFFVAYRWASVFIGNSSYFFENEGECSLNQNDTGSWLLAARSSTKGFSQSAPLLLDWLKPWLMAAPWEVLAATRYEEQYDYNQSYAPCHRRYWLVDTEIVSGTADGDIEEIEFPLTLSPTMNYQPVQWQFGSLDDLDVMRSWNLDELSLPVAMKEAITAALGSMLNLRLKKNRELTAVAAIVSKPRRPAGIPEDAVELITNYLDVKAYRGTNGMIHVTYPPFFDPNLRKNRKRRNLYACIPRVQARGYYVHSHKGRGFRQGIPRPRMPNQLTVKDPPPLPPQQVYIDTENSFNPQQFLKSLGLPSPAA